MKIQLLFGAFALALGACSAESTPLPDVTSQTQTSAQSAPLRNLNQSNLFAGFQAYSPTDPQSWRSLNDAQSEASE